MKTVYVSLTEAEALQLINTKLADVQERIDAIRSTRFSDSNYAEGEQRVNQQLRQLIDVEHLFRDLKNAKENA